MVRRSTQHGLYEAMQRFHPDMPCVRRGLSRHCRVRNTDHDGFVFCMHLLDFRISLAPVRPEQGVDHVMCRAVHPWQAAAIHEWMDAGYFSLRDAHVAGWPLAPWQWGLENLSPWHGVSVPLQPDLPILRPVPRHCAFVTDGSWFPSHCCGGAFAVVCLDTLTWVVYPVSVPCHLDHSYAMEVYTSWVLCQVKHTLLASGSVACATARSLREGGSFIDSKSYIQTLCSRRPEELGTGLVDLLLADCVRLAGQFPPPQHLYSHQHGTFLDLVLDDVDREAKAQALRQPHTVPAGYLAGLQVPQPAFCKNGVQKHDTGTVQYHQLHQLYAKQQEVLYASEVVSYAYYATCVASGSLSWGDHLRMVTFRHELGSAVATRCVFCDNVVTASHFQETCRYSQLWSAVLYTQMASDLCRIVPAWSVSLPTCWGVLAQWGGTYLGNTTEPAQFVQYHTCLG